MAGKKQPGRFTIQFSAADPQQRLVIELLNQQGRRKAAFLTNAVLSYCGQNVPPAPLPQQMDLAAIEQVVRKVLQECPSPAPDHAPEPGRAPSAPYRKSAQPTAAAPAETELPDDVLGIISDMIDAFRG